MAAVAIFEIKTSGMMTTIQDRGRFGYGRYGVAPSGALDTLAMRVANLLVDNPEEECVLEITLPGFKAVARANVTVAVTGADLGLHVNDQPVRLWGSYRLAKGDTLDFRELNDGCRAYLAVAGGVSVPPILGSKATNLSSGFGGLEGRRLQDGDVLWSDSTGYHSVPAGRRFGINAVPKYGNYRELRVVPGPQDDQFCEAGIDRFFNACYRVSPQSDRTGIRLQGPKVGTREGAAESILSEGVVAGAVQVPGDGQPIIILGETISGGYRKIATVITADLHLLGQILPGDQVRFQAVGLREARQALWRMEEMLGRFRDSLT